MNMKMTETLSSPARPEVIKGISRILADLKSEGTLFRRDGEELELNISTPVLELAEFVRIKLHANVTKQVVLMTSITEQISDSLGLDDEEKIVLGRYMADVYREENERLAKLN